MSKTKTPQLTPDEASEMLRRRIGTWKKVNPAREKLDAREKALRTDIKLCLLSLGVDAFEAASVKAQIITSSPIKTADAANIEALRKVLTPTEFEELVPRSVDAKALRERKPEILKGLKKGSKKELRMDYVQGPAPVAKGA